MKNYISKLKMIRWNRFDTYYKMHDLFSPVSLASEVLYFSMIRLPSRFKVSLIVLDILISFLLLHPSYEKEVRYLYVLYVLPIHWHRSISRYYFQVIMRILVGLKNTFYIDNYSDQCCCWGTNLQHRLCTSSSQWSIFLKKKIYIDFKANVQLDENKGIGKIIKFG